MDLELSALFFFKGASSLQTIRIFFPAKRRLQFLHCRRLSDVLSFDTSSCTLNIFYCFLTHFKIFIDVCQFDLILNLKLPHDLLFRVKLIFFVLEKAVAVRFRTVIFMA